MAVVFPLRNARGLAKAGVPADPPADAPKGEYAFTLQRILELIATPDLFFQQNEVFQPLQETTGAALKKLLDAGIISRSGEKPRRRGGCGGCARRKLLSFALQFAARFQTIALRAQQDPELKARLEADLRAYVQRQGAQLEAKTPLVLYARNKKNKIRKVVL